VTRGPHRPAANLVALAVLALALFWGLAGALPGTALASTVSSSPVPAAADRSGPAALPPLSPAAPVRGPRLELRVASMSPRVVTSTGSSALSLTGTVVNTGDQVVRDVEIRAQRGDRLRTEGDVRTALNGDAANDAVTPPFAPVTDELEPGKEAPVQLQVPLRGTDGSSLALQRAGVYELLVNINGIPDSGEQARLAGARMLLPVLGLPAADGRAPEPAVADTTGAPTPVSMLYPLAEQPRRLPTGPGEPVLLGDDSLAASLSPGGRLDGLLAALEAGASAGSPLRDAICLAVDPDLLRTAADMSGGYRVHTPDGQETDGRGAAAAGQWLDRLRAVAAGRCVVAMPFADTDLVALSRAGLDDLANYATADSARIAADILRTPVRANTTWPADGVLDERSLTDYVHGGGQAVVLSADAAAVSGRSSRSATGGLVRLSGAGVDAIGVLADPLVTLAARGTSGGSDSGRGNRAAFSGDVGSDGVNHGLGSLAGSTTANPAGSGTPLAAQDLIGTTAFRALAGTGATAAAAASTPLLIAPPHSWGTTGTDARELLSTLGTLIAAGRLAPAPLPGNPALGAPPSAAGPTPAAGTPGTGTSTGTPDASSQTAGPDGTSAPSATLVYPVSAGAREVPGAVTTELRSDRNATRDLRSAAEAEPGVGATPAQVFDPVTEGMLRAGSAVWRGNPELSDAATTVITRRVALLRSLVRVLEPPSPYALGDKEAPLPITLANGLPVAMLVRVALSDTPGLRTEDIPEQRIPPMGRLQLRVNAQLTRSGQFSVEARLTTVAGSPLGVPSRLLLRSTAYGTITVWLTGTAGLLLVILAVRRIARRLRGAANRRSGTDLSPATPDLPVPPPGDPPRRPTGRRVPAAGTTTSATTSRTPAATTSTITPAATPRISGGAGASATGPTRRTDRPVPAGSRPVPPGGRPRQSTGRPNRIGPQAGPPPATRPATPPIAARPATPPVPVRGSAPATPAVPPVPVRDPATPAVPPGQIPPAPGSAPVPPAAAGQPGPPSRPGPSRPGQPDQPGAPATRPIPKAPPGGRNPSLGANPPNRTNPRGKISPNGQPTTVPVHRPAAPPAIDPATPPTNPRTPRR